MVLTINNGVLYRTRNFVPDYRYTLNFVDGWSIDEVILLDISSSSKRNRGAFVEVVKQFTHNCFVPLTLGGGVLNLEDFSEYFSIGADKVAVNSLLFNSPSIIHDAVRKFGTQSIVASIDAVKLPNGEYAIRKPCGGYQDDLSPKKMAQLAQDIGVGEVLIQSVERDGTLEGYDLDLARSVNDAINIPMLLCSGAGRWEHLADGLKTGAACVCTTNIFHFTEKSIASAKAYLKNKDFPVRL